jgi:hypothetical protein
MNYQELMAKARKTNKERELIELKSGYRSPDPKNNIDILRTIMLAIACGIKLGDWNAVAEGQAMLEEHMKFLGQEKWLIISFGTN